VNFGGVAVDSSTNTIYVSLGFGATSELQVIDATTCNATLSSCSKQATVTLGDNDGGGPVAVDSATHTVYVGGAGPASADISVVDARHCYAADMSGCATQTPVTIPVDQPPQSFAVGPDTLYVSDFNDPTVPAVVDVVDTRRCQAADTTQCTQTPPAVTVGVDPAATVLDLAHHTLYVVDNANGESPGLLSLINTTHCNGDDSSACASQNPLTTPLPRAPLGAVLDPSTNTLSVTNFGDASVSRIDTATCNATTQAGCLPVPPQVIVGSGPFPPALDPSTHTVYVPNFYDSTVSIISSGQ
jgi:DNA-binding beta-propeller fold protein YncE